MADPKNTVLDFLAQWGKSPEAINAALRSYFLPTTVWENVGFAKTTGPEEAIALMLEQPSIIKRPVLDVGGKLLVGFKPETYEKALR